jgi:predicted nucleotidyltransferase
MSNVTKGLRGYLPPPLHPDVIPVPTHVSTDELGPLVPIMSNSPTQWIAKSGMCLRVLAGSGVHGMAIANQDDRDELGVFVEPPEYVIGSKQLKGYYYRTQPEGVCSGPGDLDLACYTLRRYIGLAAAGNPTVLLPLFVPDHEVCYINDFGRELRDNRHWFISKSAGPKFRGYLESQRRGLMGLRSGGTRNQGRKDIRDKMGFDSKFAAHMIRLGVQGVEMLRTREITLPIPEPDLTYLRDLKQGVYLDGASPDTQKGRVLAAAKKAECLEKAEQLERQIDGLLETSRLPDQPDWKAINAWSISVHRRHWKWA